MVNIPKLVMELQVAGIPITGIEAVGPEPAPSMLATGAVIRFADSATEAQRTQAEAILAAHDPHDYVEEVRTGALTQARTIPNWASWDEATMQVWFEENISNALAAATTLAQVKSVLQQMALSQQKMARMVIALRNQLWPEMQQK